MQLKEKSGVSRELIPARNYLAVVVGCYDLGTHKGQYGDKHRFAIAFELHGAKGVRRDASGRPLIATKSYNVTFNKNASGQKSSLREDAEAILGRVFSDDEAQAGDLNTDDFADRFVRLNVKHEAKPKGEGFWEVVTLTPYDEDDPELQSETDTVIYDLDPRRPFPDGLPKWVQNKVQKSKEWVAVHGLPPAAAAGSQSQDSSSAAYEDDDDDPAY